jgi:hypothetical protein
MQETFEDVSMDESSSNAINAEQLGAAKRGGNGGGGAMSSSHPSEDSETGNRSKVTTASAESVEREIAKKETSIVIRLRLFVFLFLSAVATFVASAVYLYLFTTEQDKFITTFHEDADKILEAIGARIHKSFGLLDSLAVLFISFSQVTKQQFPYVTMNDFAVRMAKVLPLTDSISISILPVVTAAQRDEWEAYTLRSDQWVNDSVKIQRNWEWYHGPSQYNGTQYGRIHGEFGDVPDDST